MSKVKRSLSVILTAVLVLQAGLFTVYGESGDDEKRTITISNIDMSQLTGISDGSSTEIVTEGIPSDGIEIVSEEWTGPAEYVISGSNITIKDGRYSYRLVIRSDRTLTFDNDLEIYYQGVKGRYKLHYDIDENDDHTMIVTGVFENIIVASPLLEKLTAAEREWILSHISEDSYFYQLVLKTKEGFSFINTLRFLFDARRCGYSIKYCYDLLNNRQTLIICGIPDCDEDGAVADDGAEEAPAAQESATAAEPPATPEAAATAEPPASRETATAAEPSAARESAAAAEPSATPESVTSAEPPASKVTDRESVQDTETKADAAYGERKADAGYTETGRTVKVRYSRLRKKAQTLRISKAAYGVDGDKGRFRYVKVSGNKKIKVDKKTGRISVKKGLEKGSYRVTVKLKPAGNAGSRGSGARRVSLTVKVV